ncbi:MAG: hypothetical protein AAGC71_11295 [Pseudomonadota bacterium]
MNDDELKALLKDSGVSTSTDFTHTVMKKIDAATRTHPWPIADRAWLLAGLFGLVLVCSAQFFVIDAALNWVASVFSTDAAAFGNTLRRPLLIAMSLLSIVSCSQIFKMYRSDRDGDLSR